MVSAALCIASCSGSPESHDISRAEVPLSSTHAITLSTTKGADIFDVTLGATKSINLGIGAAVSGANDTSLITNTGTDGINVNWKAKADHIASVSTTALWFGARLDGDLLGPSFIASGATVAGTADPSAELEPPKTYTFDVTYPPLTDLLPIYVGWFAQKTLEPGRYGTVSVAGGGTLTIKSGEYHFERLKLASGSTLRLVQQEGPTRVFTKEIERLEGQLQQEEDAPGLVLIQTGNDTIQVKMNFRGVLVAPRAKLEFASFSGPHRGVFHAKDIKVGSYTQLVHQAPDALVGVVHPPEVDPEACARAIAVPSSGNNAEYQTAITEYCSVPNASPCQAHWIGQVNADYTAAAGAFINKQKNAAEYLAVVRDRTRKEHASEDAQRLDELCEQGDDDADLIPNGADQCPDTPPLTPTDDEGCVDSSLPAAPDDNEVREFLDNNGVLINAACSSAAVLPRGAAGAFYRPADQDMGSFIFANRVTNQPSGCPIWYFFDIQEYDSSGPVARYTVAFHEDEESTALVGMSEPVPPGYIQFNPRPTDDGTRGVLGSAGGRVGVRFRVRAMNGAGMYGDWSAWKTTDNSDCINLGFQCL